MGGWAEDVWCAGGWGRGRGLGFVSGLTLKNMCLSCEFGDAAGGMSRHAQSRRVVF